MSLALNIAPPAPGPELVSPAQLQLREGQYALMSSSFGLHGGLVGSGSFLNLLKGVCSQPISRLARGIVDRTLVNFSWQGEILIPLFQFSEGSLTPRPELGDVLAELRDDRNDWELAHWFALPHPCLDERPPAALLASQPACVLNAARVDRFITHG